MQEPHEIDQIEVAIYPNLDARRRMQSQQLVKLASTNAGSPEVKIEWKIKCKKKWQKNLKIQWYETLTALQISTEESGRGQSGSGGRKSASRRKQQDVNVTQLYSDRLPTVSELAIE